MEAPKSRVGRSLQFHQEGDHQVAHQYKDQGIGEQLRVGAQAVLDDLTGVGEIGDGGDDRSQ